MAGITLAISIHAVGFSARHSVTGVKDVASAIHSLAQPSAHVRVPLAV